MPYSHGKVPQATLVHHAWSISSNVTRFIAATKTPIDSTEFQVG
jgi:hypothetical protein